MMTTDEFANACIEYNKEKNIVLDIQKPTECPVHIYAALINSGCNAVNPGTKTCKVCGGFVCPVCTSHSISVISRITGYISTVSDNKSGWNNGKLEEFKQRKRYVLQ